MLPSKICVDGKSIALSRNSLSSERVRTLKIIAKHLKLKLSGNKAELVERIVNHINENNANLCLTGSTCGVSCSPVNFVTETSSDIFPFSENHREEFSLSSCVCRGACPSYPSPLVACIVCGIKLHVGCMGTKMDDRDFLCPGCRLKLMDPFYATVQLLYVSYIHQIHPNVKITKISNVFGDNKDVDCYFQTNVGVFDAKSLQEWRRSNYDIILRCISLSSNKPYNNTWPRTFNFRVNNVIKSVQAPRPDVFRRDVPIIITPNVKTGSNQFELVASDVFNLNSAQPYTIYAFAIIVCTPVKIKQFVSELYNKYSGYYEEHKSRAIKAIKSSDADDDVLCVDTSCKLKLRCPITLMPMEIPCRGIHCKHLQCYDMESYFKITQNTKAFNNRWKCPECQLITRPEDLVMDAFVLRVLIETAALKPVAEVVEINRYGEWKSVVFKDESDGNSQDHADEPNAIEIDSTGSKDCSESPKVIDLDSDSSCDYIPNNYKRKASVSIAALSKKPVSQSATSCSPLFLTALSSPISEPYLEFQLDDTESLSPKNCAIIVFEVQSKTLPTMMGSKHVLHVVQQLMDFAELLDIPVVITEQNIEENGTSCKKNFINSKSFEEIKGMVPKQKCLHSPQNTYRVDLEFREYIRSLKKTYIIMCGIGVQTIILWMIHELLDEKKKLNVVSDATTAELRMTRSRALQDFQNLGVFIKNFSYIVCQMMRTKLSCHIERIIEIVKRELPPERDCLPDSY